MGKVSIKGVLTGGIVDVVTSFVVGLPFALYTVARRDLSHVSQAEAVATVSAEIRGNLPLYLAQLAVGLASAVLGGYVAASIAKHDELINGLLSAFLSVVLGIYIVLSGRDYDPHWLQIMLLIASPALGLLGGGLARRRHQRLLHAD